MAKRKVVIPEYGTVMKRGVLYYRTRIRDANGKLIALYARTPEELYDREIEALEQIDNATFHRKSPTVAEYCEKWLLMQSVHIRATTLTDYTSKVRRHIIKVNKHAPFFGIFNQQRAVRRIQTCCNRRRISRQFLVIGQIIPINKNQYRQRRNPSRQAPKHYI